MRRVAKHPLHGRSSLTGSASRLHFVGLRNRRHDAPQFEVGGARHPGGQLPLHPAELAATVGPCVPESADRRGAEELIRPLTPMMSQGRGPLLG